MRAFQRFIVGKGLTARAVQSQEIADFRQERAKTVAPSTLRHEHSALRLFYADMFARGDIVTNPTLDIEHAERAAEAPSVAADPASVQTWIAAIEAAIDEGRRPQLIFLKAAALVALCTLECRKIGQVRWLRVAEALKMCERDRKLSDHTRKVVRRLCEAVGEHEFLFFGRIDYRPMSKQNVAWSLRAVRLALGLPPITFPELTNAFRAEFLRADPDVHLLGVTIGSQHGKLRYELAVDLASGSPNPSACQADRPKLQFDR